jgi:protein phosphatase
MKITIPELSLVVMIGASGSGKSTFAHKHFKPTEVLSSDVCRAMVSDDENDQAATNDAFDVLHYIAAKRLAAGKLVVVDATNVQPESRKPLVELARQYHCLPVAIVLNMSERLCQNRNKDRPDRDFGPHVVRNHQRVLRQSLRGLGREGFRHVFTLNTPEDVEAAFVTREPLYNNRKDERGPFDIIGDVHGCYDELCELLTKLGYTVDLADTSGCGAGVPARELNDSLPFREGLGVGSVRPPDGRKVVFLGDLVDRGPDTPDVLRLVMGMVAAGTALCVPGNHDIKLLRKLSGKDVQITYGLAETLQQLDGETPEFVEQVRRFLDSLVSHYVLDGGKLVVAHAGMKAEMQGRGSGKVREFALYGETTGETDQFGLPIRYNWAEHYRGAATVVYGHTPIPVPEWLNHTINIDTGCVFGGSLTALRWPERELVPVPGKATYAEPMRPFLPDDAQAPALTSQQQIDDLLDISDVLGKRIIETRLQGRVTIREENSIAALEVMSRFAANPKWLIYLPPTMSPSETTQEQGLLEHPREAFAYYRNQGIPAVVCEEKHMGSRAVVIVCRDEDAVRRRFGIEDEGIGICVTRTGRRFFDDDGSGLEQQFLDVIGKAMDRSGLWDELGSDWVCLDCELMPWSAKAQSLIRQQYAAVGAAAMAALPAAVAALTEAAARKGPVGASENGDEDGPTLAPSPFQGEGRGEVSGRPAASQVPAPGNAEPDVTSVLAKYTRRLESASLFVDAYRRYCWPVNGLSDLKLAPFHILASEGAVHVDKDHLWHMQIVARLCAASDGLLMATAHKVIDVTDEAAVANGIAWWTELTGRGGEGMVVKPLDFVAKGSRGLVQPAVKCRGREYLRIIYGPDYTAPENLERLRSRGLAGKRALALREFALGIEGLERFVRYEPLRRVHECAFGVLALESEPVDPRL